MTHHSDQYLDAFLEYLLAVRGYSQHTLSNYKRDIEQFLSYCQTLHKQPGDLTEYDLISYLAFLSEKDYAMSTLARKISSLKSFYRFLHENGDIPANPTRYIQYPKHIQKLPEVVPPKTIFTLLDSIPTTTPYGLRDRALFELLYATGLRISELLNLKLQDIDFEEGIIRVKGKGGKYRQVPFHNRARTWLERYLIEGRTRLLGKKRTDFIFLNRFGRKLSRVTAWSRLRTYTRSTGLPQNLFPHLFRHSFATHLLEGGADIRVVQVLLGHASIQTTEIYTHIASAQLRNAVALHPLRGILKHKSLEDDTPHTPAEALPYTTQSEE